LKTFHCTACEGLIFFENFKCLNCGRALAFSVDRMEMVTLNQSEDGVWWHEWMVLTYVLNNLTRGLGLADAYPFVLSVPVIDKLRFVCKTMTG
jgi:hypothetical protein